MYRGETVTGPQGGSIAIVTDGSSRFEIHPLAQMKDREFYAHVAAVQLAEGHAAHLNRDPSLAASASFVRVG